MSEYRQDDRNEGYCPVCAKPLTGLTVAARGYCEQHGWQWADWTLAHQTDDESFPCAACGAEHADWDDNADSLRCPEHHMGGREIDPVTA